MIILDFYTGFMLLRFCPYVGTWRFLWWCILIFWHVYFGDVWLISAATVDESYICMLFEFWCEDVASISWIFILFACIIACHTPIFDLRGHWHVSLDPIFIRRRGSISLWFSVENSAERYFKIPHIGFRVGPSSRFIFVFILFLISIFYLSFFN